MSEEPERLDPREHPGVRGYTFLCLAALLVVVVLLVQRDMGWLALLPLLTGSVAVAASWGIGPPAVLLCVAGGMIVHARFRAVGQLGPATTSFGGDMVLAGALLAYCAGQYRLQSLVRQIFPPDPRRKRRLPRGRTAVLTLLPAEQARSPELVGPNELTQLVLSVLCFTGLTATALVLLARYEPPLDFNPREWQILVIAWTACGIAGLTWLAATWGLWRAINPEESLLYLQDQLWSQTRREQSRLNRWRAWYRLRRQRRLRRKEGKS
jgi:hypothetical protein